MLVAGCLRVLVLCAVLCRLFCVVVLFFRVSVFVHPFIALTAAHSIDKADEIWVEGRKATHHFIHPAYKPKKSNYLYDIGILIFDKAYSYSPMNFNLKKS